MASRYNKGFYRYEVVFLEKGEERFGGKFSTAEEAHAYGKTHAKLGAYRVREIKKEEPPTNVIPFPKKTQNNRYGDLNNPNPKPKHTPIWLLIILLLIILSVGYVAISYLHYLS